MSIKYKTKLACGTPIFSTADGERAFKSAQEFETFVRLNNVIRIVL